MEVELEKKKLQFTNEKGEKVIDPMTGKQMVQE